MHGVQRMVLFTHVKIRPLVHASAQACVRSARRAMRRRRERGCCCISNLNSPHCLGMYSCFVCLIGLFAVQLIARVTWVLGVLMMRLVICECVVTFVVSHYIF